MKRLYVPLAAIFLQINSVGSFMLYATDGRLVLKLNIDAHDGGRSEMASYYDRRAFFHTLAVLAGASCSAFSRPSLANARGLVSFPCVAPLLNVYHIMRAGTSLLDEEDIWSTNPLFLTNRESALSPKGVDEAREACRLLQAADINPSVIKYSLAASAVDSAMVIRDELTVGQNRMIPEFTFMDPRAIGGWDMMSLRDTYPAIVALDELDAGSDGTGARPPPNIDGTPQDTLADQAIRLRQLMSILETQFSGDNIVLVFPDGSSPALLSAMIAGIPYNKAHVLDFSPGEIRLDVTLQSTLQLYESKLKNNVEAYNSLINSGKKQLERLRSIDDEDLVSKKDLLIEKERVEMEQDYRRKEEARLAREERQRGVDLARMQDHRSPEVPADDSTLPVAVIGGAFFAYAALATSRPSQPTELDRDQRESDTASGPATVTSIQMNAVTVGTSFDPILTLDSETRLASTGPYEPKERSDEERLALAQDAMQNYIDQDDGGSAWLQVMAEIIDEGEDIDPKPTAERI
jgi:broad specificity phosphatase PhoE